MLKGELEVKKRRKEKGERENGNGEKNGRRMGEMGRETRWILGGVGRGRTKAKGKE